MKAQYSPIPTYTEYSSNNGLTQALLGPEERRLERELTLEELEALREIEEAGRQTVI